MKVFHVILVASIFMSWTVPHKVPYRYPLVLPFSKSFKAWDSVTINALERQMGEKKGVRNKVHTYINSLSAVKIDSVDFFGRGSFLKLLDRDSSHYSDRVTPEAEVVEFSESSEKIIREKFLIIEESDSHYCYSFSIDTKGGWYLKNRNAIKSKSLILLDSLINNSKDQISLDSSWGWDINQYLIVSRFNGTSLSVKPILFLPTKSLRNILDVLKGL